MTAASAAVVSLAVPTVHYPCSRVPGEPRFVRNFFPRSLRPHPTNKTFTHRTTPRPILTQQSKWKAARNQSGQSSPQLHKAAQAHPAIPTCAVSSPWREPTRTNCAPAPPANKTPAPALFQLRTKSPSETESQSAKYPATAPHGTPAAGAGTCKSAKAREYRNAPLSCSLAWFTHESNCKKMADCSTHLH